MGPCSQFCTKIALKIHSNWDVCLSVFSLKSHSSFQSPFTPWISEEPWLGLQLNLFVYLIGETMKDDADSTHGLEVDIGLYPSAIISLIELLKILKSMQLQCMEAIISGNINTMCYINKWLQCLGIVPSLKYTEQQLSTQCYRKILSSHLFLRTAFLQLPKYTRFKEWEIFTDSVAWFLGKTCHLSIHFTTSSASLFWIQMLLGI